MSKHEIIGSNPEAKDLKGLERAGEAQREILEDQREKEANNEKSSREKLENAKHEVENALNHEKETPVENNRRETSPAENRNNFSPARAEANFNATMNEVRSQMSAPSRTFSKVIHNKAVEKVSEVAGATIARPNAILAGAIAAFLLTLTVYLIAKHYAYELSGFETIGAFAFGWVLGVVYDFLRVMITGRSSNS